MADEHQAGAEQEERTDEEGRNPTQQRMDEEGVEAAPVDASWTGADEGGGAGDDWAPAVAAAGPAVPGGSYETGSDAAAEAPDTPGPAEAAAPNEPVFEPDVPLVAEVNREAEPKRRKGMIAAVGGALALAVAVVLRRRR